MIRQNQQEDTIPPLIPLERKKVEAAPIMVSPSENNSSLNMDIGATIIGQKLSKKKNSTNKEKKASQPPVKEELNPDKLNEIEKKSKQKLVNVPKFKYEGSDAHLNENQKSKMLIAEMLSTISVKNITEEVFPVSNEVIQQIISQVQNQINELQKEAETKENSLNVNPNNNHLRKQLDVVKREINHCITIKELYFEKLNSRNRNMMLEKEILKLKHENYNLRVKVAKGIEMIENYKHNLPCEKEKELKERLQVVENELSKEKEMRSQLENNTESLIMSFNRLYEQADAARLIVTQKLRDIDNKQKQMTKTTQPKMIIESPDQSPMRKARPFQLTEQKKQNSNSFIDSNQQAQNESKKTYPANRDPVTSKKDPKNGEQNRNMTMMDRMKVMRNNQNVIHRLFKN